MNISENSTKALLTAGVAGLAASMIFGESGNSTIAGISLPAPLVIGAAGAAGSFVSDSFSDTVLNMIPQSVNSQRVEATVIKLGLSGGATAGALMLTTGLPSENLLKAVGLGAGSKIVGDWTANNIVNTNRSGFILPI